MKILNKNISYLRFHAGLRKIGPFITILKFHRQLFNEMKTIYEIFVTCELAIIKYGRKVMWKMWDK